MHDIGWVMPGVGIGKEASFDVVDAVEDSDKHRIDALAAEHIVHVGQTLARLRSPHACGAEQGAAHGHEDRGRYTLARHVGDDESHPLVIHFEEIEEITSHLFGGGHRGIEVHVVCKFADGWKQSGQDGLLYLSRYGEVALDGFQLSMFALRFPHELNLLYCLLDGA